MNTKLHRRSLFQVIAGLFAGAAIAPSVLAAQPVIADDIAQRPPAPEVPEVAKPAKPALASMEDIRPGMSRDDEARVTLAIFQALNQRHAVHYPIPKVKYYTDRCVLTYELSSEGSIQASWVGREAEPGWVRPRGRAGLAV
jgi:hypothetical protein